MTFRSSSNEKIINGDIKIPMASGFKLYVLWAIYNAIQNKNLSWTQIQPIVEEWKSIPAGVMQTWPSGKEVSIQEYAEKMISISDNTATDHLIHILGRDAIIQSMTKMGNKFIKFNTPFLFTSELFKLKYILPKTEIAKYLNADSINRLNILDNKISKLSLKDAFSNGVNIDTPAYIDDLEWFASTNDLCSAMQWLQKTNNAQIFNILSINTPLITVGKDWKYAGHKSGSETGVLTKTYLLQNKQEKWACFSIAWNNSKEDVNKWIFFDVIKKTLNMIANLNIT